MFPSIFDFILAGQDVSMYILLPDSYNGLPHMESLTVAKINNLIDSMREEKLALLQIPKFKIKNKKVGLILVIMNFINST